MQTGSSLSSYSAGKQGEASESEKLEYALGPRREGFIMELLPMCIYLTTGLVGDYLGDDLFEALSATFQYVFDLPTVRHI